MPLITVTPTGVRSTKTAITACSAKAAPTMRRLMLRLPEDNSKAKAKMARMPSRLNPADATKSFTAYD